MKSLKSYDWTSKNYLPHNKEQLQYKYVLKAALCYALIESNKLPTRLLPIAAEHDFLILDKRLQMDRLTPQLHDVRKCAF